MKYILKNKEIELTDEEVKEITKQSQIKKEENNKVYAVYLKDEIEGDYIFKGTLEEINAWLSLREKGFNI
jgi:hypothetical protein